ncbi:unnamed protein product [Brassica rapa]|uniref:Uncharacterized protein n=1 Tax=Brassica campestris TaxID=3711 RepID=A0A3P6CZ50_BRACM|nr:unnamed protein product [Brassica rapa]VDD17744.1 unnamed protein product [Brassica rapa]
MGVDSHDRLGLETAFFRSVFRTTASSRGNSFSCRRGCVCLVFLVGSCVDFSRWFVLGRVAEAAGAVASRFEGAYLLVARGDRLFFSDLPVCFWSSPVSAA